MKEIVDYDGDLKEVYHKDAHDDKFHIEIVQDVQHYLKSNKMERDLNERKGKFSGGMLHKVASIPEVVLADWHKELGANPLAKENRNWLIAKLNSSEFAKLRTREGRI